MSRSVIVIGLLFIYRYVIPSRVLLWVAQFCQNVVMLYFFPL